MYVVRLTEPQLTLLRDLVAFAVQRVDRWAITFAMAPRYKEEVEAVARILLEAEDDGTSAEGIQAGSY